MSSKSFPVLRSGSVGAPFSALRRCRKSDPAKLRTRLSCIAYFEAHLKLIVQGTASLPLHCSVGITAVDGDSFFSEKPSILQFSLDHHGRVYERNKLLFADDSTSSIQIMDAIGCGICYPPLTETCEVFFTKNGKVIFTQKLSVSQSSKDWFPFSILNSPYEVTFKSELDMPYSLDIDLFESQILHSSHRITKSKYDEIVLEQEIGTTSIMDSVGLFYKQSRQHVLETIDYKKLDVLMHFIVQNWSAVEGLELKLQGSSIPSRCQEFSWFDPILRDASDDHMAVEHSLFDVRANNIHSNFNHRENFRTPLSVNSQFSSSNNSNGLSVAGLGYSKCPRTGTPSEGRRIQVVIPQSESDNMQRNLSWRSLEYFSEATKAERGVDLGGYESDCSLATSLCVEVASLDGDGSYVSYGASCEKNELGDESEYIRGRLMKSDDTSLIFDSDESEETCGARWEKNSDGTEFGSRKKKRKRSTSCTPYNSKQKRLNTTQPAEESINSNASSISCFLQSASSIRTIDDLEDGYDGASEVRSVEGDMFGDNASDNESRASRGVDIGPTNQFDPITR